MSDIALNRIFEEVRSIVIVYAIKEVPVVEKSVESRRTKKLIAILKTTRPF